METLFLPNSNPNPFVSIISVAGDVWFVAFPIFFYLVFKMLWMEYVQDMYADAVKWTMLELIAPRDIEKSPLPMESIFAGLAGVITTPTTADEFIRGWLPVKFSFEIASIDGAAHFYIRTPTNMRNLVEAHFYAQYPDVEIVEVEDFTDNVPRTIPNKDWDLWGSDLELVKPDLFPIRTYKFFEESVTGKMIDPLAGLVETMGKAGPGQQIWVQWIVIPEKETWYKTGKEMLKAVIDEYSGKKKEDSLGFFGHFFVEIKDIVTNLYRALLVQEFEFEANKAAEKKDEQPLAFRLTPGQTDVLKALESNLGKQMFRVKGRFIYMARREVFSKPFVSSTFGSFKQFSDQNLNSFRPRTESKTEANYLFVNERLRFRQRRIFRRFRRRDHVSKGETFLLSSEELATVFHLLDMTVMAPNVTRISGKRGGAPINLPIQLEE